MSDYTQQDVIGYIKTRLKDSATEWPDELWDILKDAYELLGSKKVTFHTYIDVGAQWWDLARDEARAAVHAKAVRWNGLVQADYPESKVLGHYVKKVDSEDSTMVRFEAILRLRVAA